jgi:hypothetical protein
VTVRRYLLAMSATALLAAVIAAPALAQSPSAPAVTPAASVPAGPAIKVVAKDYTFLGLPTTVPVGTTLTLDNQGQEVHMMLVVRKNDGVTKTWDELLAMPGNEADQYVTYGDPLVAAPGMTAPGSIVIAQTGEYFALCFVPQGTTSFEQLSASPAPSAAAPGTPHFMLGMRQTFTGTEAGTAPGPLPSPAPMASPMTSAAP